MSNGVIDLPQDTIINQENTLNSSSIENDRRSALLKIGKFTAYAVPSTIAIISSKPAHASGLFNA